MSLLLLLEVLFISGVTGLLYCSLQHKVIFYITEKRFSIQLFLSFQIEITLIQETWERAVYNMQQMPLA